MKKQPDSNDIQKAQRDMEKLMRQIGKMNFNSEEELKQFMGSLLEKNVDDIFDTEANNKQELALDILEQAYEKEDINEGRKLARKAIKIDPVCLDAYIYLGDTEKSEKKRLEIYEKATVIGEAYFGEAYFEENKGHFWGLTETRPYMRAKMALAESLMRHKYLEKAAEEYFDMLELNPHDNQGVRYLLLPLLFVFEDYESLNHLLGAYIEDASPEWLFAQAFHEFISKGATPKAESLLKRAHNSNKFVIKYLLQQNKITNIPHGPQLPGGAEEAIHCATLLLSVVLLNDDIFNWLRNFTTRDRKLRRIK